MKPNGHRSHASGFRRWVKVAKYRDWIERDLIRLRRKYEGK